MVYWFSFDVMGTFALSKSFDMLDNEQWHYAVRNLRRAMSILGPLSSVPWLAQIGFKFLKRYWLVRDWHSMTGWCRDRMRECITVRERRRLRARRRAKPLTIRTSGQDADGSTSIASHLVQDSRARGSVARDNHLFAREAVVAIVAGR